MTFPADCGILMSMRSGNLFLIYFSNTEHFSQAGIVFLVRSKKTIFQVEEKIPITSTFLQSHIHLKTLSVIERARTSLIIYHNKNLSPENQAVSRARVSMRYPKSKFPIGWVHGSLYLTSMKNLSM